MTDISLSVGIQTKGAEDTLNALINKLKDLDTALEKATKANMGFVESFGKLAMKIRESSSVIDRYQQQLDRINGLNRTAARSTRTLGRNMAQTVDMFENGESGARGYASALQNGQRAANRAVGTGSRTNAILSDQVGFWRFAGRAAALYFSSLATDRLIAVNLEMQALQQALNVIAGSQEGGAESMEFVSDTAQRLGIEISSLGQGYKLLSAATRGTSLEGIATQDIFSSVAEAATAMKLSVADTDGVMRALSQIMSKGKVSSEELRQQLGDRLPGAFQAAARAMNVTTAELNKMLENGEVISEEFLPKFAKELKNTFEASPEQLEGPDRAINRMKNSFIELGVALGEAGLNEAIVNISNSLSEFARSETAKTLVEGLGQAMVILSENIDSVARAFSVLAAGFATRTIVNTVADVGNLTKGMFSARSEALSLGGAFTKLGALATVATASFQFGDILINEFSLLSGFLREFGSNMFEGILDSIEGLKFGFKSLWAGIKLTFFAAINSIGKFFITSADGWLQILQGVGGAVDKVLGTDFSGFIKSSRDSLQEISEGFDEQSLGRVKKEVEDISQAWKEFDEVTEKNNKLFEEQRELFLSQAAAAERSGMSLGDYIKSVEDSEKALKKKAEADRKAAKEATLRAEAEKKQAAALLATRQAQALLDFDDLSAKYDKTSKAIQEQAEALAELSKIRALDVISNEKFLDLQNKILRNFQSQLNPVQDIIDEMQTLKRAYELFDNDVERNAFIKAMDKFADEEVAKGIAKATKESKDLQEQLKFDKSFTEIFEDVSMDFAKSFSGIGDSIGEAINTGDWEGIGQNIGSILSGSIGDLVGQGLSSALSGLGAFAGPIGGLVGGIAGGLISSISFGSEIVDPTEKRQSEQSTGTVLGDINAKSESIANATDLIAESNEQLVNINRSMLNAMVGVQESISQFSFELDKALFDELQGVDSRTVRDRANELFRFGGETDGSLLDQVAIQAAEQVGLGRIRVLDTGIQVLGGSLSELLIAAADDTLVTAFIDISRARGLGSDIGGEITQSLGSAVNNQFQEVLLGIVSSVESGLDIFGIDQSVLDKALGEISVDTTKISLEGLDPEEQVKELNSVFSKVFDELAESTLPFLESMQKSGEGLGETLARVSTEYSLAAEAVSVLGFQVGSNLTDVLVGAASDLVNQVGGIEQFSSALLGFEANFLDTGEQLDNQGRRLNDALSAIGESLPETKDGFKELVQGLDATNDADREALAILLKLQGEASKYYDLLETSQQDVLEQQQGLANIRDLELRLMQLQGKQAEILNIKRQEELDALEGLANADEAAELINEIYDLEIAALSASSAVQGLANSLQEMVDAAVDAFFALDFQAFNLDGSALSASQIEAASQALVEGVGGISEFNSAVSSFTSNFISEEFKFAKSSARVEQAFAKYNAVIPATREGFAELFRSLNAITDANAIADALKIADDAATYYAYLEKQAESIFNLELRLLKAQGNEAEALARSRQKELDAATDSEKAILRMIFAAEDQAAQAKENEDLINQVADVQERLNDAYRDQINEIESTASKMRDLEQSLRGFGTDLALGNLSALSPQEQLALARSEFESTASAAQAGDINALGRLQEVATAFLEESREFQGSGGTFAQDFAQVQEVIANSATVADIQADQAERQAMLMQRQLERQGETLEETQSIKEALLALIAVQKETGVLSTSQLEAMKRSLAILESNSSLSSSQL